MLAVSKKIKKLINEINPYTKGKALSRIQSPVNGYEIYLSKRGQDNAYFIWSGKYLTPVFSSFNWDISDFRSSVSYANLPDAILRAMDRHNGGGFKSRRDIIDLLDTIQGQLCDGKTEGAMDDLSILLQDLNEENEYDSSIKVCKEIAEHEIGRKVST